MVSPNDRMCQFAGLHTSSAANCVPFTGLNCTAHVDWNYNCPFDAEVNVRYSVRTSQRTLQVTAMTNGLYTKCCIWQQCLFVVKCLTRSSDMTRDVAETFSVKLGGTESQTWPSVGSTPS